MTIDQFLTWLASAGGAPAAAAFVAERLPAFQQLPSGSKSLAMLGASLAIALAAYLVLTLTPAEQLAQIAPIFQVLYGVVGTWIAGQVAHSADPAR